MEELASIDEASIDIDSGHSIWLASWLCCDSSEPDDDDLSECEIVPVDTSDLFDECVECGVDERDDSADDLLNEDIDDEYEHFDDESVSSDPPSDGVLIPAAILAASCFKSVSRFILSLGPAKAMKKGVIQLKSPFDTRS